MQDLLRKELFPVQAPEFSINSMAWQNIANILTLIARAEQNKKPTAIGQGIWRFTLGGEEGVAAAFLTFAAD